MQKKKRKKKLFFFFSFFFPEKKNVPTLPKIFRPATRKTPNYFIWPYLCISFSGLPMCLAPNPFSCLLTRKARHVALFTSMQHCKADNI